MCLIPTARNVQLRYSLTPRLRGGAALQQEPLNAFENTLEKHPGSYKYPLPELSIFWYSRLHSRGSPVPTLTIAQLPGDVVLLAGTVLQQAEGIGAVPGVVGISAQSIQCKDQVKARTVSKVIEFV